MSDSRQLSDTIGLPAVLGATALAVATHPRFDEAYQQAADDYARAARAANTVRAYSADWRDFLGWCQDAQLEPLPALPETIGFYISDLAKRGRKPATIERRLQSIRQAHLQLGYETPTAAVAVRNILAGIKRTHGTVQDTKAPALVEDLKAMVGLLGEQLRDVRDRALLLVGFAGAFRREELAAIDVADLEWTRAGVVILVRRSKTDQEQHGRKVGIPFGNHVETCPVRALRAWMKASSVTSGRVFRGVDQWNHVLEYGLCDRTVARVVKRRAAAAGLDAERFGGHSLRAGLATAAAIAGVEERKIMAQTGHKSVEMVRRYIRDADLFRDNAAAQVGL